jgi:hypothetical protein
MFYAVLVVSIFAVLESVSSVVFAWSHIHARAGDSSAQQLLLIVAKDLGFSWRSTI